MNGFDVLACPPQDTTRALDALFASMPESMRRMMVASISESFDRDPLSRRGLLIAREAGGICGAVLVQEYAGKTAVLWPPHALRGGEAVQRGLVEAADEHIAACGADMAQALLPAPDKAAIASLEHVGFVYLTQLEYLIAPSSSALGEQLPDDLRFEPYNSSQHSRLAALVEATYCGTQDCPELNGVRDIDDVLLGYQSSGTFDPEKWFIVSHAGCDVGVVLLTEHPSRQWELVYMALVPQARRRGFGTRIVRFAIGAAFAAGMDSVLLAVDARNEQGLGLYRKCGFRGWDRRIVYWKRYARDNLPDSAR